MAKRKPNAGSFKKGPDPRRHRFTQNECVAGFWAAIEAIIIRHPDAVDSSGRHMACNFLKRAGKERATSSKETKA